MSRAFTLLEMVLVLVVISIIYAIGAMNYHPKSLRDDVDFIKLQIEKRKREAIAFDHREFGGGEISDSKEIGCITLTKEGIESASLKGGGKYKIKSTISGDFAGKKICFDYLGAPSEGNYTNRINSIIEIVVSYNKKSKTIKLLPLSGYVIIN